VHKTRFRNPRQRHRFLPTGLAVLATVALLGPCGCRHADPAQQRLALRGERIGRTVEIVATSERSRPQRLRGTLDAVHNSVRQDAEASRANVDEINSYWQRRWHRWIERQSVYGDEIGRILRGSPGDIEGSAIIMFF